MTSSTKISCEQVRLSQTCSQSIISELHATGNDGLDFISAVCGGNAVRLLKMITAAK
ncbi:hypothetical protein SDC9_76157 [bioreactor metagenome]|uniref:Uncharacterized protein n=1 Tax=bioreactor metagenome TaxID=1076179 RepID=A0A644YMV1_9ZZZZ